MINGERPQKSYKSQVVLEQPANTPTNDGGADEIQQNQVITQSNIKSKNFDQNHDRNFRIPDWGWMVR